MWRRGRLLPPSPPHPTPSAHDGLKGAGPHTGPLDGAQIHLVVNCATKEQGIDGLVLYKPYSLDSGHPKRLGEMQDGRVHSERVLY